VKHGTATIAAIVLIAACGAPRHDDGAEARAVPMAQSAAARALRIPRMRLARVALAPAGAQMVTVRVLVVIEGRLAADSTIQARSVDPSCTESFVDTAVVREGNAVSGVLLWVEGAGTVFSAQNQAEYRPTVVLEKCRLKPRVQLAAPGSTIQLATHDARTETLVVVPPRPSTPIDTITFNTDGQLVPVRQRADSTGVLGVYSTRLPWARAYVAIAPPGGSAITDATGAASFTFDRSSGTLTIRAWHPSLGVVAGNVTPSSAGTAPTLTLTYRR
jgi:hypothetical protein